MHLFYIKLLHTTTNWVCTLTDYIDLVNLLNKNAPSHTMCSSDYIIIIE